MNHEVEGLGRIVFTKLIAGCFKQSGYLLVEPAPASSIKKIENPGNVKYQYPNGYLQHTPRVPARYLFLESNTHQNNWSCSMVSIVPHSIHIYIRIQAWFACLKLEYAQ